MSMESDFASIDAMNTALDFVAKSLGIVVLQAKNSDKVYALWIYNREIKGSEPRKFEQQQIVATSANRRSSIGRVIKGMSELGDIDLAVKFISYKEQAEIVKNLLGNNLLE